ncbi:plasmid mobilization protein [Angustibacter luteus]|uniref:Plasmid mobilization relaxosome protein MobC n=1 Tax=Angustibacter luteus TaxID=658456 RepID=A0ABW1JEJ1_9ACTN
MSESQPGRRRAPGRDRDHLTPGRPRQVKLRYSDDEYAAVVQAAREAGLTPTGYAAEAALAAARGTETPSTAPWRVALLELMDARGQVRRVGVNINQATRAINATGEAPDWLDWALAMTDRTVDRLDQAAAAVTDVARQTRRSQRTARHGPTAGQPAGQPAGQAAS